MQCLSRCTKKRLVSLKVEWAEGSSACVVAANKGYPGKYETGAIIEGLDRSRAEFSSSLSCGHFTDCRREIYCHGRPCARVLRRQPQTCRAPWTLLRITRKDPLAGDAISPRYRSRHRQRLTASPRFDLPFWKAFDSAVILQTSFRWI